MHIFGSYDLNLSRYPSSQQYNDMVSGILYRWPHLSNKLSTVDAINLWKHFMRGTFKNLRRHSALKDNADVLLMKSKYGKRKLDGMDKAGEAAVVKDGTKDVWGVPNLLPNRVLGEDEQSLEEHIKRLRFQSSMSCGRRNLDLIRLSLDKTFPERRKYAHHRNENYFRSLKHVSYIDGR